MRALDGAASTLVLAALSTALGCESIAGSVDRTRAPPDPTPSELYAKVVLADAPVGFWRLEDPASATTIADESAHGADGAPTEVALELPGIFGDGDRAAHFDGADAHIDVPVQLGPELTIETWVKLASFGDQFRAVFSQESFGGPTGRQGVDMFVGPYADSMFGFNAWQGGAAVVGVGSLVPVDQWRHVVVTCSQSEGVCRFFLGGKQEDEATIDAPFTTPALPFSWGHGSGFDAGAVVDLDELAIYDHALTPERVSAHFEARP